MRRRRPIQTYIHIKHSIKSKPTQARLAMPAALRRMGCVVSQASYPATAPYPPGHWSPEKRYTEV